MKRSTAKWVNLIAFIIEVVLAVVISRADPKDVPTMPILIGSLVVYAAVGLTCKYFLRCPKCGKWPSTGAMFRRHCVYCGEPLDKERE